ncbi:hypothetical protein [Rhodoferax sp.]|uniref:hypothetical protein n=1 Tax=Rhodoferax sp. TaxID=50421 RepID=UPI003452054B
MLLPLTARFFVKKWPPARKLSAYAAIHFVVGGVVLGLGLVLFGRDGKMLTYLALVVMGATSQWLMSRR